MLIGEPRSTRYDLQFSMLGFPVRVHPGFFILPLLLGSFLIQDAVQLGLNAGVTVVVLAAVFFISILVHELGHALAFRFYGYPCRILLYWMGGLAIPDGGGAWSSFRPVKMTPNKQIIISLAGPVAGFLLAGLMIGLVYAVNGRVVPGWDGIFPMVFAGGFPQGTHPAILIFLFVGVWCNVFWNVLNLMPVFPLDGGQVARSIFIQLDSYHGIRNSIYLSIGVGGAIAVYGLSRGDHFMAILFGMLAVQSYMSLQAGGFGGGRRPW